MVDIKKRFQTRESLVILTLNSLHRIHGKQLRKRLREECIPLNFEILVRDDKVCSRLVKLYADSKVERKISYILRNMWHEVCKKLDKLNGV